MILLGLILCGSGFAAPKTVGIYVGNNHFPGIPGNDLQGCINDANLYATVLQKALGGIEEHKLPDATKGDFVATLRAVITRCQNGEVGRVIIAISSHGTLVPGPNNSVAGQAIVFSDVDGPMRNGILADREFRQMLDQIPTAVGVELLLDTCYSGGASKELSAQRRALGRSRFIPHPGFRPEMHRVPKRVSRSIGGAAHIADWAASSEDEKSQEEFLAGEWHGLFTYVWAYNFSQNPQQPRRALIKAVQTEISKANYTQHPQILTQ